MLVETYDVDLDKLEFLHLNDAVKAILPQVDKYILDIRRGTEAGLSLSAPLGEFFRAAQEACSALSVLNDRALKLDVKSRDYIESASRTALSRIAPCLADIGVLNTIADRFQEQHAYSQDHLQKELVKALEGRAFLEAFVEQCLYLEILMKTPRKYKIKFARDVCRVLKPFVGRPDIPVFCEIMLMACSEDEREQAHAILVESSHEIDLAFKLFKGFKERASAKGLDSALDTATQSWHVAHDMIRRNRSAGAAFTGK